MLEVESMRIPPQGLSDSQGMLMILSNLMDEESLAELHRNPEKLRRIYSVTKHRKHVSRSARKLQSCGDVNLPQA